MRMQSGVENSATISEFGIGFSFASFASFAVNSFVFRR